MKTPLPRLQRPALLLGLTLAAVLQSACAPLLVGGAALGGTMVVTDRRSSNAQLDDKSIELKAFSRVREVLGDRAHVNANSYNRTVLLTGEVFNEADRGLIEQSISRIEGVKSVVNELGTQWPSSTSDRANDVVLAGKVKATFIDAKSIPAGAFKVVVERRIVYLMGRVTEQEATHAAEMVSTIAGVQKVVRVVEVVSQADLDNADGGKKR